MEITIYTYCYKHNGCLYYDDGMTHYSRHFYWYSLRDAVRTLKGMIRAANPDRKIKFAVLDANGEPLRCYNDKTHEQLKLKFA